MIDVKKVYAEMLPRERDALIVTPPGIRPDCAPAGYRLFLWRRWDGNVLSNGLFADVVPASSIQILTVIMFNPSTADSYADDPTIRDITARAKRFGFGALLVVNLWALRTSYPTFLRGAAEPQHPDNDAFVLEAAKLGTEVVVAWGTNGDYRDRDKTVLRMLKDAGITPKCWNKSKDGHPMHPLARGKNRIPVESMLFPFEAA